MLQKFNISEAHFGIINKIENYSFTNKLKTLIIDAIIHICFLSVIQAFKTYT